MSAVASMVRQASNADGLIKGVCARLAARAGVPVWMPRAVFVIFGLLHWLFALVLYFVMAKVMCDGGRARAAARSAGSGYAGGRAEGFSRCAAGDVSRTAMQDRFSALDKRLADMEAASLAQEAGLRRAFRDLERG